MNEKRTLLVRYDEIGLKGGNRKFFESCLLKNIKQKLKDLDRISTRKPHGRILVDTNETLANECVKRLQEIPGIASISVGVPVESNFERKLSNLVEPGILLVLPDTTNPPSEVSITGPPYA